MRNNPRKLILVIENDPIRTWRASIIHVSISHDRELVVRPGDREIETLVVVVFVRVGVFILPRAVEVPPSGLGGAHSAGGVADAATGVGASADLRGSVGEGGEEENG